MKITYLRLMEFFKARKIDIFLLLIGGFMGIYFSWSYFEIALFLIFLWSILGPIKSCYLSRAAIFLLILIPIVLMFENRSAAEIVSVYCFYFLVMAVIRAIIEIRNEKTDN